jgi:4a-hydroxytetrahydrobiopterin dehydratase
MNRLADEALHLCKKGDAGISKEDAETLLTKIPAWSVITDGETVKLMRVYTSRDYEFLLALMNKFGAMAQQVNHHPALLLEWGKLTVTWWTHTIEGLHRNDFIMAARCDRAAMLVHGL